MVRPRPKKKVFEPGQSVEIQRGVGTPWESAVYIKKYDDWKGHHSIKLIERPRRIDTMTGEEVSSEDGGRTALVWSVSVPTQRVRVDTKGDQVRDRAVEIVDRKYGYTMEFAPSPAAHREEYASEEARLRHPRMATQLAEIVNAPLAEIVNAAAKRFDERPLYPASVEARKELGKVVGPCDEDCSDECPGRVEKMSDADKHWTRGYAAALATTYRNHHERDTVKHAMTGDGITVDEMVRAGVEDYDLDVIKEALR